MPHVRADHRDARELSLALVAAVAIALPGVAGISTAASAQDAEATAEAAAAGSTTDTGTDEATATVDIDGTWALNTDIGSFEGTDEMAPFSSSWVGFRVSEVLRNIGDTEAVGRTPFVSGQLEAGGSAIESAAIEVDLTTITSDRSRRDRPIQDALDTSTFPTASFESTAAVELGAVPVDGEPFSVTVPGTLTIRGVGKDVELQMDGQRVGDDLVVVVGTLPIDFTEFDVTMPVLGPVVSVEDTGSLEWLLYFEREG